MRKPSWKSVHGSYCCLGGLSYSLVQGASPGLLVWEHQEFGAQSPEYSEHAHIRGSRTKTRNSMNVFRINGTKEFGICKSLWLRV